MNSDSDPPFPPMMAAAEMLNTFETDIGGSMQDTDNFFNSALSSESSDRLFPEEVMNNSLFQPIEPAKMQPSQESINPFQSRPPTSTSPASSLQDSSSDSSMHRKRKSSSKSSQSAPSTIESPMENIASSNLWNGVPATIKRESTYNSNVGSTPNFESLEFKNGASAGLFDFDSAGSSPSQEPPSHNASFSGPRHVAIQYQDSPGSTASFLQNNTTTREVSPMSNMVGSEIRANPNLNPPIRPSPLGAQEDYLDSALLRGMEQRSWPFGEDPSKMQSSQLAMFAQQANLNNHKVGPTPTTNYPLPMGVRPTLIIHQTPQKSRVETQIPLRITLYPLPKGVTKLHLPPHTISKPKLLVRPPPTPSPDTLELQTSLVCTSAMQDRKRLERALFKAANPPFQAVEKRRLSAGEQLDKDDEDHPLNGGEVRICDGCIVRERKRAARKKSKKPEEEEPWQRDEGKRVVVFNTNEIKDWQPPQSGNGTDAQQDGGKSHRDDFGFDLPDGAMQVEIPMRIACYCRHQNEKLGFQVILTIKDYQNNVVAQSITQSIIITDDHKTHGPPGPIQPHSAFFGDQTQILDNTMFTREAADSFSPSLYRNAHSTTDLQSLQQNFNPQFVPQTMAPFAVPQNVSQAASGPMAPRSLSRQASPSAPGGPVQKKRKASGGVGRVPNNLTMTRLQTEPSAQDSQWSGPPSASSVNASTPYTPAFPPGVGPQTRPQAQHVSQRSGHFTMGPQTPINQELEMLTQANRSQSFENFAGVSQMYSAPPSALPSRAPSPSGGLQMANVVNNNFGIAPAHGYAANNNLSQQKPPTINKLIPSEGPKAGGIEVTCLGSGFYQGLEVMFGDSLATTTTYWGETSLVCLLPPALRAGTVPVTFKHQYQQQQQAQFGRFPSPPLSKAHTVFRYIDDDEQELLRQALLIVSQKMRGDVNDAGQVARWIVNGAGSNQGSWLGGQQGFNRQHPAGNAQSYLAGAVDCEGAALKCLELIDLDESPFPARLNLRKQNGQTLLHLAASLGYHRLVAGLLARGANPDCRDRNGMSPMHMAALNGHAQIVRRLRVSGGDSTMRSLSGYTPADMATSAVVLDAVETLSLPRSRSAGPRPELLHSRTSSSCLGHSTLSTAAAVVPNGEEPSSEESSDEDSEGLEAAIDSNPVPPQQWPSSRRNSGTETLVPAIATPGLENNHGYMFAVAAMTAWRDQIAAQWQQLQQSVNFTLPNLPALPGPLSALPPMPNLPDYQAYPMMRRFSSFVPHRSSRPASSSGHDQDQKDGDSKWWEFLTGGSSPPAYEEIYPTNAQDDLDTKTASAARAAADAAADQKCSTIYDTVTITGPSRAQDSKAVVKQDEEFSLVQRKNVKRLRSDRKLFFIWIPLLIFVMVAMLKDRVPEVWRLSQSSFAALSEHYQNLRAVKTH